MLNDTILEIAPEAMAKTFVVKENDGRWEAHQAGRLFASWPDEISARIKLLEFQFNGYRVIWM